MNIDVTKNEDYEIIIKIFIYNDEDIKKKDIL